MSKENTVNQGQETSLNIDPNLSKGDVLKRYTENKYKHWLYGVVSFAMTAMFYVSFTSPAWVERVIGGSTGDAVSAGIWAFVGFLFSVVITVLIMHSHTTDNKQWKFSAYALILVLGIGFNVFTETASTMDRVDERVTVKSEQSGLFKALTSKIQNSSGETNQALIKAKNDYADAVSTARARCGKGSNYSARLCKKWTMRADEYKTAIDLHKEGASTELQQTVTAAKDASHNEEYAQMVIKLAMEKLNISYIMATGLISLFIIGTYELLGVMIGSDYRRYRDALPRYGIDLHRGKEIKYLKADLKRQNEADAAINQFNIEQGKMKLKRMTEAKKEKEQIAKLQEQIKKLSSGIVETVSPTPKNHVPENAATAKSKNDVVAVKKSRQGSKLIPKNDSLMSKEEIKKRYTEVSEESAPAAEANNEDDEQDKSVGFDLPKSAPSTAEKNRRKRAEKSSTSNATLTTSKQTQSSENHPASYKVANNTEKQTVTAALKNSQKIPATLAQSGSFKVVDKVIEKQPEKSTTSKQSQSSERVVFSDTDLIYPEWRKAVSKDECKLTSDPCRDWVKKHLGCHTSRQVKRVTNSYASQIAELLYMRGLNDRLIIQNPEYKKGNRKVKYLKA